MQLTFGTWRHCHWQCLSGAFDAAGWDAYLERLMNLLPVLAAGDVVLDIWHDCGRPSPTQREQFTAGFAMAPGVGRIAAHAFVTNSALSRGVLTAVNWVVRRPFDEKLLATPQAGLAWLHHRDPTFDVVGMHAELHAKIPGFAQLRW